MAEVVHDPAALARRVLALCPMWLAADLAGFEYLPGGYSNQNYQFVHREQRYVLRVPERERPFVDRALEEAFYRSPGRVLVPEIEAFDSATGVMISRWKSGPLLAEIEVDLAMLVPYVKALHEGLQPCARSYDPVAMARQHLSVGEPDRAIAEFAETLTWEPEQLAACHNDLNPWNIIRSDRGQWVTLDWEWLGENDPLFDLVTLHQGLSLDDAVLEGLAREFLGGAEVHDTHERLRDCLSAFWLREYAWAHAERVSGNDRSEILEQIRVSQHKLDGLID